MSVPRRRVLVQLASLGVLAACTKDEALPLDSSARTGDSGRATGDSGLDSADTGDPIDACDSSVFGDPGECERYPDDGEGPFYRDDIPERDSLNVWEEEGEELVVLIRMLQACVPVEGIKVEIWAASQDGPYDMTSEDANMYGYQTTNAEGIVCFKCVRPPPYRDAGDDEGDWIQAHFHLKIWQGEEVRRVTQIRFADDPYRDGLAPEEVMHEVEFVTDDLGRMTVDIEMG